MDPGLGKRCLFCSVGRRILIPPHMAIFLQYSSVTALVLDGIHEGLGRHVGAQVDDFQVLACEHYLNQVLAEVMPMSFQMPPFTAEIRKKRLV